PLVFFFQAEDGIRDFHVTGVQTCALPILRIRFPARCDASWSRPAASRSSSVSMLASRVEADTARSTATQTPPVVSVSYPSSSVEIGRASCRERGAAPGRAAAGAGETTVGA